MHVGSYVCDIIRSHQVGQETKICPPSRTSRPPAAVPQGAIPIGWLCVIALTRGQ